MSATEQIAKLKNFVDHEMNMAIHVQELSRTSLAVKIMVDKLSEKAHSVNQSLFRLIRIQLGYSASKHILPWLSPLGFKVNEMMYCGTDLNGAENPCNSIDHYLDLIKPDENFYSKLLAFILIVSKRNQLNNAEIYDLSNDQLNRISSLVRYNGFTIDHFHQSSLMPQFNLAEDQTGLAFIIMQIVGRELDLNEIENIFSGCESLYRYSTTLNSIKLYDLEIQVLRSGKTKFTLPTELAEKLKNKVMPFVRNFESLWVEEIRNTNRPPIN